MEISLDNIIREIFLSTEINEFVLRSFILSRLVGSKRTKECYESLCKYQSLPSCSENVRLLGNPKLDESTEDVIIALLKNNIFVEEIISIINFCFGSYNNICDNNDLYNKIFRICQICPENTKQIKKLIKIILENHENYEKSFVYNAIAAYQSFEPDEGDWDFSEKFLKYEEYAALVFNWRMKINYEESMFSLIYIWEMKLYHNWKTDCIFLMMGYFGKDKKNLSNLFRYFSINLGIYNYIKLYDIIKSDLDEITEEGPEKEMVELFLNECRNQSLIVLR